MPQAAVPLAIGATVIGSANQARAARRAASAQENAADQAAQVQREALQQYRLASEPFRFGGQQAINPLLQSLGIQQIGLPNQPIFNMLTGAPTESQDRRAEIEARLKELRAQRGL
jgi:type II secretory pathway pseudopilin PulG